MAGRRAPPARCAATTNSRTAARTAERLSSHSPPPPSLCPFAERSLVSRALQLPLAQSRGLRSRRSRSPPVMARRGGDVTVVIDNGGGTLKVGFAGDAEPVWYVSPARTPLLPPDPQCSQLRAQPGRQAQGRQAAALGRRGGGSARPRGTLRAPPRRPWLRRQHAPPARHLGPHLLARPQGTRCEPALSPRHLAG